MINQLYRVQTDPGKLVNMANFEGEKKQIQS